MSKAQDVLNFWLPWNHTNQGTKYKMPDVEITNTETGETTNYGGAENEYVTKETANPTMTGHEIMINDGATSTDVADAINEYNRRLEEYNAEEQAYRRYVNDLAQKNWEDEFGFEQDKFKQQIKENQITRDREDSEYQRTMRDLALAGINPLMVGRLNTVSTSLGQVAGNAPNTPSFHAGTPSPYQSQAGVVAQERNSLRDYEIMGKQIELEKEKLREEERRNKSNENIERSKLLQQVRYWDNQLTQAGIELTNANLQAQNERELRQALQDAEHANKLIELDTEYGLKKELADKEAEAKQKLQDSINRISAINTGNKVVDTIIKVIFGIIKALK